jgi:hypothetical protein
MTWREKQRRQEFWWALKITLVIVALFDAICLVRIAYDAWFP